MSLSFQEVVGRRRMIRSYEPTQVASQSINRLIENATRAPNAGFTQGWAFLVLDRPDDVDRFWDASTPPERAARPDVWLRGMRTAPVVIVPLSSKSAYLDRYAQPDKGWEDREVSRWPVPYWHVDAGMASLLILLSAVDEGLGACFFAIPGVRTASVRAAFGIPSEYDPVGAITVGYPAPDGRESRSVRSRERKATANVTHYGHWSG